MTKNTIEQEVNKARIEIYNEQKNLSPEERATQMQEKTKLYAKKYGMQIASTQLSQAQ